MSVQHEGLGVADDGGTDELLVLAVSAEVAGHLAVAVDQHLKWARRSGLQVPAALPAITRTFANRARRGQAGTPLDDLWQVRESAEVPGPLLLTVTEASARLGVSERTVKRLMTAKSLAVVRVLGSTRIAVEDVNDYVNRLRGNHIDDDPKADKAC